MVIKNTIKIFSFILTLLFGSCMGNAQRLKNIKYFTEETLKSINTRDYYQCIGVYFSDKNYNIIRELKNTTTRILKFRKDGYIESNIIASNKNGYSGVIYSEKGKLKINLIGGTSDRSKVIRTYKVRIEGSKLHLLEEAAAINELIYYVYEVKK